MDWDGRYEALRSHAVGDSSVGLVPLGLAVLQHRGVAAWMVAESHLDPAVAGPSECDEWMETAEIGTAFGAAELVRLLAETALLAAGGQRR